MKRIWGGYLFVGRTIVFCMVLTVVLAVGLASAQELGPDIQPKGGGKIEITVEQLEDLIQFKGRYQEMMDNQTSYPSYPSLGSEFVAKQCVCDCIAMDDLVKKLQMKVAKLEEMVATLEDMLNLASK